MNYITKNKFLFIEKSWNHLPNINTDNNINIIHWNGLEKPWKDKNNKINRIWWKYFERYKNLK